MNDVFEIAGGSVVGTRHIKAGKNNQDAFYWMQTKDFTIAVVTDGCGSGKFSEVGSRIGARLFVNNFIDIINQWSQMSSRLGVINISFSNIYFALELARRLLLRDLRKLIKRTESSSEIIGENFLFTLVGAVVTQEHSLLFYIGDGALCENGAVTELGPYPKNQPPYLAYDLFDETITGFSPKELMFGISCEKQTCDVQSILIGTDGVMDLIRSENEKIPGKEEAVGQLSQFWENDLYFKNPDALRRRLAILNRESVKVDWEKREVKKESGLLPDDTTLVVIRRKKIGGEKDGNISKRE